MEKKQIVQELVDSMHEFVKDLTGIEQNHVLSMLLRKIQADRVERHMKIMTEAHTLKASIEELDKMTREAVKY